jgi:hypothetical protein
LKFDGGGSQSCPQSFYLSGLAFKGVGCFDALGVAVPVGCRAVGRKSTMNPAAFDGPQLLALIGYVRGVHWMFLYR